MGSILRITWLAWSSHKWAAFGMIGVMVLWGISPIFELNALIQFTNLLSTFQIRDNFQPLVNHLFLFILWSLLIPNLCWQVYYFLFDIVRQYAQKKIAFDSLDKATKLPLKALEDSKVQDLIFRTSRIDTGDVLGIYLTLTFLISGVVRTLSIFAVLFVLNHFIFVTVFFVALPTFVVKNIMDRKSIALLKQQTEEERLCKSYLDLLFDRDAAKELYSYSNRMALGKIWLQHRQKLDTESLNMMKKKFSYEILAALIRTFGLFAVLLHTLHLFMNSSLDVGAVSAIIFALQHLQWLVSAFVNQVNGVLVTKLILDDFRTLMNMSNESETTEKRPRMESAPNIALSHVFYKYVNSEEDVLRDIDITIHSGEKVAIVGKNGSGKSTLLRLILGLDVPDQGKISFNQAGRTAYDGVWFRENTTAMLQDFTKYFLSVRENVAISDVGQMGDEGKIINSLAWAKMLEKVKGLKNGLDTILNPAFGGVDLSGGEWQRIGAARAYFRDRFVLVFDEPTASLDAKNETQLYEQFMKLSSDRTSIVVSHRLPIARLADKVIVMDEGKVVEYGSHAELMARKGLYYNMFKAQSSMYVNQ
jgi:ATP-binding cassette subfamily B protein